MLRLGTFGLSIALGWILGAGCSGKAVVETSSSATGSGASSSGPTTTTATGNSTGSGAFGACNRTGQCILTHYGCCASCTPPLLGDLAVVAQDQLAAFRATQCTTQPPCCAPCINGEIFAYCDGGQCTGADLDSMGVKDCSSASDCVLRWGANCWEPCGGIPECDGLTAVNTAAQATLAPLICDPDAPPHRRACRPIRPMPLPTASPDGARWCT